MRHAQLPPSAIDHDNSRSPSQVSGFFVAGCKPAKSGAEQPFPDFAGAHPGYLLDAIQAKVAE